MISEMDKYGLYQGGSDNPILFTIQFYSLCKLLGGFDEKDRARLHQAINALAMRDKEGRVIPGLYTRRGGTDDDWVRKDQHDNYDALASSSMFGDDFKRYAKEILEYGRKNFWSYDNRKPYKFSFECLRQGWNMFHFAACCDKITPLQALNYVWYWGATYSEFAWEGGSSGKMLSFIRFGATKDLWYIKPMYNYWKNKVKEEEPDEMVGFFKRYHGENSDLYKLAKLVYTVNGELV